MKTSEMLLKHSMIISTHCADFVSMRVLMSLSISALTYLSMLSVSMSVLVSLSISALTYLSMSSVLMSEFLDYMATLVAQLLVVR